MLKRNLYLLFTITIFAVTAVILCISNYNPYTIKSYEFAQFYSSLFLALGGVISIIIYSIYFKVSKDKTDISSFWFSVRQAALISLSLTLLLFLRSLKLLDIWTAVSLIIIVLLFELFFRTKNNVYKEVK